MNVSKEAREAAASVIVLERGTADFSWLADQMRRGLQDDHPAVQAFAKFEAEITQRVRDQALEEAARVVESVQANGDDIDFVDAYNEGAEDAAAAIRQMIGGGA